ncbi:MAG: aspartate--tRNA ligase [Candidatus Gracilibacteria bacterium]
MYRSHLLDSLSKKDVGKDVVLSGWVHRRRDHGGIIFIDLRDRYGLTQIHSDPIKYKDAHNSLDAARSEYVLRVEGSVRARPKGQENPNLKTGDIEVLVKKVAVLSKADTLPFEINQDRDIPEELRLKYRYLDLRRDRMKNNIIKRTQIIKFVRDFMEKEDFLEIETPILIKGTPEGSREYIVPSRLYPGNFYVLPQSPQQLKQLLMVASFDKYFQIARCFRDEDQRGDRQPEFTQLDVEMSFVEMEDIIDVNNRLIKGLVKKFVPHKKIPEFVTLTYNEAMDLYGSDKPDLRFDMPISDITDIASECGFGVFKSVVENGGCVKVLRLEGGAGMPRSQIDSLEEFAKEHGAKGLAYIIIEEDGNYKSPIAKFFKPEELEGIASRCQAEKGDVILFAADKWKKCCEILGAVRLKLGDMKGLRDENVFAFCWITHFPLFEYKEEEGKLDAVHHPFTSPIPEHVKLLDKNPEEVLSNSYDIVLNGVEIGGGSIRIHDRDLQAKVFKILGITDQDAETRFGHMLKAFNFGVPPHGGIAWGLDRLIMIFQGEPNIREVIPFPKDQQARDLMLGSPSVVPVETLNEAHIKVIKKD